MKQREEEPATLLASCRVLDLTDEKGFFCGKILGDVGADVILIEKPGGHPARSIGPFYRNIPHPEKSLFWFAYNANKRGITLDIETEDGRELFKKLVKTADFVIESFPPGHMDKLGIGYSTLSQINRGIIMVSITPFGQTGPYKDYKAYDIVGMAMGGLTYITGDMDRPPVGIGVPQAYLHAASEGAVAATVAYYYRESSGEGQHVDVSMQQSVSMVLSYHLPTLVLKGIIAQRVGCLRGEPNSNVLLRQMWPCKDGYVSFILRRGEGGTRSNHALMEWMESEGISISSAERMLGEAPDLLKVTQEEVNRLEELIGKLFAAHTRAELYEGAVTRRILLQPVYTLREVLESDQLKFRGFWTQLKHPELDDIITYPGTFIKASETPCSLRHRAPLIGEHNGEIYCQELGLSTDELAVLRQAKVI